MSKKKATRQRRSFTTAQKAEILRRHLSEKVPVSQLCEEHNLQPSVFYNWQRQAFLHLESALGAGSGKPDLASRRLHSEVETLRERLKKKDEVIAEVAAEMVNLKKELGEL